VTPFRRQLGWTPSADDAPLAATEAIRQTWLCAAARTHPLSGCARARPRVGLRNPGDTCCLAAGFLLIDAGLAPTMLRRLTVGSSPDRSADLGARLWRHRVVAQSVLDRPEQLESASNFERA
jgi:hypothetical protein